MTEMSGSYFLCSGPSFNVVPYQNWEVRMKAKLIQTIVERKLSKGMTKAKCCQMFHR